MKRLIDVRDPNSSSSDPTPSRLDDDDDDDDDDDIQMDFKKTGDGKAWTGFIWLMIGTVAIYNPHETVQHLTNTERSATQLPETKSCEI